MDVHNITIDWLKKHHINNDFIIFFKNNFPLSLFPQGLDLSKVTILFNSDELNIFKYIESDLFKKIKYEYDVDGNVVKKLFYSISDDTLLFEEIYSNNLLIKNINHENNLIDKYKYDGEKCVCRIFNDGSIYCYEYDNDNKLIKSGDNVILYHENKKYKIKSIINNYYKIDFYYRNNLLVKQTELYLRNYKNIEKIWYFYYDKNKNLIKTIYPDNSVEKYNYKYDKYGRLVEFPQGKILYIE